MQQLIFLLDMQQESKLHTLEVLQAERYCAAAITFFVFLACSLRYVPYSCQSFLSQTCISESRENLGSCLVARKASNLAIPAALPLTVLSALPAAPLRRYVAGPASGPASAGISSASSSLSLSKSLSLFIEEDELCYNLSPSTNDCVFCKQRSQPDPKWMSPKECG